MLIFDIFFFVHLKCLILDPGNINMHIFKLTHSSISLSVRCQCKPHYWLWHLAARCQFGACCSSNTIKIMRAINPADEIRPSKCRYRVKLK